MQNSRDPGAAYVERKRLKFRTGMILQRAGFIAPALVLLFAASSLKTAQAQGFPLAPVVTRTSSSAETPRLIVIGFMGGRVKANNLIHREALLARELQERDPQRVYAEVFANHKSDDAFKAVMRLLGADASGHLSRQQREAARVVIYGHSWGASETVALARRFAA